MILGLCHSGNEILALMGFCAVQIGSLLPFYTVKSHKSEDRRRHYFLTTHTSCRVSRFLTVAAVLNFLNDFVCSFGYLPGRQIVVCRRFGTLCQFHLQKLDVEYTPHPAFEDGTDRGFRNVGKPQSDAGEIPKRTYTTFKTRQKFEIKNVIVIVNYEISYNVLKCLNNQSRNMSLNETM